MKKPDLIDELMSTKKLNAFFEETERSMVTMITAHTAEPIARRGAWWIVGGAAGLALIGTTAWMSLRNDRPVESTSALVVAPRAMESVSQQGTSPVSMPPPKATPQSATTPAPAPTQHPASETPTNNDHLMIGQADATPTIESATLREIDSLSSILYTTQEPLDKARLAYQIGIRQRLHGDVEAAIASLTTARTLAQSSHATVLEARSLAERSRCESKRGRMLEARTLLDTAIRLLSDKDESLRQQWRQERDALAH
ncbi:hypothetical protein BH10BAC6_BH10BAC6_18320 [soil metagenome]